MGTIAVGLEVNDPAPPFHPTPHRQDPFKGYLTVWASPGLVQGSGGDLSSPQELLFLCYFVDKLQRIHYKKKKKKKAKLI